MLVLSRGWAFSYERVTHVQWKLVALVSGEGGIHGSLHVTPQECVEEQREGWRGRVPECVRVKRSQHWREVE